MAQLLELSSDSFSCPYPGCKWDYYFVQIFECYPCFDLPNHCQKNRSAGDSAVRGVQKEALTFVISNCICKIRIQGCSLIEGLAAGCF
jgi:hypothetical protein